MAVHTINGITVVIHELQSVMLISPPPGVDVSQQDVQKIVSEVVADRDAHEKNGARSQSTYQIQEPELGFDVFVRQNQGLSLYSFSETGELTNTPVERVDSDMPARSLEDDGLFHFQFTIPEQKLETCTINQQELQITQLKQQDFEALPTIEQDGLLDEIALFNKVHFEDHFKLWDLNDKSTEVVRDHFRHLQSSLSSLYIIRDKDNQIRAINGISATPDGTLAYQNMTITHKDNRGQGFMAVALGRATSDYPQATITAYLVNPDIRKALGVSAMTKPGQNELNIVRNDYLERKITASQQVPSHIREAQASIKQQVKGLQDNIRDNNSEETHASSINRRGNT